MNRSVQFTFGIIVIVAIFTYPLLRAGWTGMRLIKITDQTIESGRAYAQNIFSTNGEEQDQQAEQLRTDLNKLEQLLFKFNRQTSESWIAQKIMSDKQKIQINLAPDLITIAQKILTGKQTYVLLFQNSEELRATGGFLGSYAKIKLNDGKLIDFEIEDIYVPDGQFGWFIEAPAGAKEYLSGGDGLRLRDANWHPDFPTSAQQILTYLAWGKEAGIDGAIAVNLPVVEKVLSSTGPIFLHDYEQTVTENNFSDIARSDRDEFFPGSVQKQHFLATFFNQLLIKLQELSPRDQHLLAEKIITSVIEKDLQFFSNNQTLQSLFEKLNISGQMIQVENAAYLMLVESNVGINKANQHIDRAVNLKIEDDYDLVEITFVNRNLPPNSKKKNPNESNHLGYVNYQRILLSPEVKVEEILFDNQKITSWDEEIISNSKGVKFKQVGFLLTLPERETKKLLIKLDSLVTDQRSTIFIQKQAGLSLVPYHFSYYNHNLSLDLIKDALVNLDN
jgi:hypothetical protein